MDKYYKLAQLVKLVGNDIAKDEINKEGYVGFYLGFGLDSDKIRCTDDSGFRDVCIYTLSESKMNECVQIYAENSDYKNGKEIWKHRCFPSIKEIATLLKRVANEEPLIPYGKNNCDDDRYWYSKKNKNVIKELSKTVNKFADKVVEDKRTAKEIFESSR